MKWRQPQEDLIRLLHDVIPEGQAPVELKPMFGGPCYWAGGNMFAAVHQESLFVRLGEKDRAEMLTDPEALRGWMAKGLAYAASLPPKVKKQRQKKA